MLLQSIDINSVSAKITNDYGIFACMRMAAWSVRIGMNRRGIVRNEAASKFF